MTLKISVWSFNFPGTGIDTESGDENTVSTNKKSGLNQGRFYYLGFNACTGFILKPVLEIGICISGLDFDPFFVLQKPFIPY